MKVYISNIRKINYDSDREVDNSLIIDNNVNNKIVLNLKDKVSGELYLKIDNIITSKIF